MVYLPWTSFVSNLAKLCQQIILQFLFWATFTYPSGCLINKLNVWHMHILYTYESHVLFSLKTILWYPPLLSFQASFVIRDSHVTQFQAIRYKQKSNRSFWRSFTPLVKKAAITGTTPFLYFLPWLPACFLGLGLPALLPRRSKNKGEAKRLGEMPTLTTLGPWIKSSCHQPLNFLCEKNSHLFKSLYIKFSFAFN